ncbi:hypothetical protein FEM33_12890 [Dyadobacter flavalbus]|uniref:Spi protease inhibitor domain-containing protein n=1 Tax=Dyadobacter flavalbus TaxID=2579942 RepID=A0A5M8QYT0_9BACT|nr:C10 family peptidase [Dyadobacter flavalbus]KAA6439172.1 hypothetical protein FEM33_12890 [Dyadobacter flavalbus]
MNKNVILFTLLCLLSGLLMQCSRHESLPPGNSAATNSNPLQISGKDAAELARNFLKKDKNEYFAGSEKLRLKESPEQSVPKRVRNVKTLYDDAGNPLMHVIHFESDQSPEHGFVILAADKRIVPVLAKSDSGTFSLEGENPGPGIWFERVKKEVTEGTKRIKAPEKGIALMWQKLNENSPDLLSETPDYEPPVDPYYCPPDTYYDSGLLITSIWRQDEVYNMYCPTRSCGKCSYAYAGCGAVAIAQVWNAKCNQKPKTYSIAPGPVLNYNFPLKDVRSTISCTSVNPNDMQIANMIRVAGMFAGSDYNFLNCNTMTWRKDIKTAFQAAGYSNPGTRVGFNNSTNQVRSELMSGHPVIMDGTNTVLGFDNWHIWVIAGIQETILHGVVDLNGSPTCMAWTYNMYYLNWGWGGNDNGWYAMGNFIGDKVNYDTSLNVTLGMRP